MGDKFTGTVTRGKQLGRRLGFPTANIAVATDGPQPAEGVYAVAARVDGTVYEGMGNVGRRGELFGDGVGSTTAGLTLEVNLFGFEGDLYGRTIEVELLRRIRGERKFADEEELRAAVERDRREIEEYFKTHR
jgi:riboflavin kinase/FMN adenylyltransferase